MYRACDIDRVWVLRVVAVPTDEILSVLGSTSSTEHQIFEKSYTVLHEVLNPEIPPDKSVSAARKARRILRVLAVSCSKTVVVRKTHILQLHDVPEIVSLGNTSRCHSQEPEASVRACKDEVRGNFRSELRGVSLRFFRICTRYHTQRMYDEHKTTAVPFEL